MYIYYEQCMAPYGHLINLCKERGKEGREREGKEEWEEVMGFLSNFTMLDFVINIKLSCYIDKIDNEVRRDIMWFPYLWAMWNTNYISLAQTGLLQIFNKVCWRKQRILFTLSQRQMYFMTPSCYWLHVILTKVPPRKSIGVIMYLNH